MQTAELLANPFSLMMNPAEVFQALEKSDRLARLQSRICRPLDKPMLPKKDESIDFDSAIDSEAETDE